MNRLLPWAMLSPVMITLMIALMSPQPAWAYERPVLTLSALRPALRATAGIRTSDPIVVEGQLTSLFRSDVVVNLYHVHPNGRVTGEHRIVLPFPQEKGFRVEVAAPRGGWLSGTLRGIVQVERAPQVRQTFELTVAGDPVPERILEAAEVAPQKAEGTVSLQVLPRSAAEGQSHASTSNMLVLGHVHPVPAAGTEVEFVLCHARGDGRYSVEASLAIPTDPHGTFQFNVTGPHHGWRDGTLVGIVRRKDIPADRKTFEARIVGPAEVERPVGPGILLAPRSETVIDLRKDSLPAIKAGMRYEVFGESPQDSVPGNRLGGPVMLELAEPFQGRAKGLIQQSQSAPTLANEAGILEFETEMEIRREIAPGTYQLHLTPLDPKRRRTKVYNIEVLPADPLPADGVRKPATDGKE